MMTDERQAFELWAGDYVEKARCTVSYCDTFAAWQAATAVEREACLELVEGTNRWSYAEIARAIRKRGDGT